MKIEILDKETPVTAFDCLFDHVKLFHSYTQKNKADSSRRAYDCGWRRFLQWCRDHGYSIDETEPALLVGSFLSSMASGRQLKASSINTYLSGIKHHLWLSKGINLDHPDIRRAMKGIRSDLRSNRKMKKAAILVEDLREIIKPMCGSLHLIDIRDKALMLLGFSGAFRRSELARICIEDVRFDQEGITITLQWSKTDQTGKGQSVQIPNGRYQESCPVESLKIWVSRAKIERGPIFRSITRHGVIGDKAITDKAVALIIKKRASINGLFNEKDVAGHSLRRGLVTSALEAKVSDSIVMQQSRHTSVNMLKEYHQEARNYQSNAIRSLNL